MLVVENPSIYDSPTTEDNDNLFVVIAIDPVASVALLEDEQATREAAAMRPTKYLALINKDVGFEILPEAGVPKLSLHFYFARDDLPNAPNEGAAIPLAPAPSHPSNGRASVAPSFPLPWPDCHVATLHSLAAIVSRIYQHPTSGPALTRTQRRQVADMVHRDFKQYKPLLADANEPTAEWDEALALARECIAQAAAEQPPPDEEDGARGMMDIFPRNDVAQMKLHVEMWVDVNSIERPGDPANLKAEINRLKQIEWDWAKRVVAESLANQTKPETSAWLDSISGAEAPAYDEDSDVYDDMDGDMSIVPEDAIEHREQRDTAAAPDNNTAELEGVSQAPASDRSLTRASSPSPTSRPSSFDSRSDPPHTAHPLRTMLVIDDPSVLDQPVDRASFVIIALDPVASVAPLRDEQATREAADIKPGRYLAYISSNVNYHFLPAAGAPRLSLSFYLAGRGLPKPPHDWAATPIAPAPAHPVTGREPLVPSAPLPWADCHIHSFVSEAAIVSRLYQHRTPGPSLVAYKRFWNYANDDNEAYESDEDEDKIVPEYEAALESFREQLREAEAEAAEEGIVPQEDESVPVSMGDIFGPRSARELQLHVEMWVDLKSISQPGGPRDFEAELARLKEIEWEWAKRVVAESMVDRPETSAWLQSISGADAPSFDDDGDVTEAPHVDMSITPEDAIEHRAERAALKTGSLPVDAVDEHGVAETADSTSASASPSDHIPAPSIPAQENKVDAPVRAGTPASDKSNTIARYSYTQSITRFFGRFLSIFSGLRLRPLAMRFRSLPFTWIWHPFAR
ncbi:hypothetical protein EXIGLDRAFT_736166 [Exidia glandulosa HHB12029]|uniref:Uncharacterized protein n=1 Tax=Exidia glandulosa HHB12029 TaxID=1314781 RepID=A0A165JJL5_EXIGL|nr:hypothetical protein EXIGLDRAFT_736166 [Exidia glandulosa HHB12029]